MKNYIICKLVPSIALSILFLMMILTSSTLPAQTLLTLQSSMDIAEQGSPSIQRSLFNIEQYEYSLKAERASLKSRFSLTLDPFNFSNTRRFDNQFSQWFTNKELSTLR